MFLRLMLSFDLSVFTVSAILLGMQGSGIPIGLGTRYDYAPLVVAVCTGIASIITAVAMMRKQGTAISKTDEVIKASTEIHTAVNSNTAKMQEQIEQLRRELAELNRDRLKDAQRSPAILGAHGAAPTESVFASDKPIEMKLVDTALPLPVSVIEKPKPETS